MKQPKTLLLLVAIVSDWFCCCTASGSNTICILECSDESNPEKPFETYAEPADLVELMSCLSTIKGGSNSHINQVDCKLENEMTIGQHLMNRFNQSNSWCILFGMQSFVIPVSIIFDIRMTNNNLTFCTFSQQLGSELKNNASLNATDSSKPQSEAKEPNRDLIEKIATDLPMTSSDKPKFTAVDTKTKVTSTTEPSAAQMTEIPTKTPSPNPNVTISANGSKKNKSTDKEHHYIGSISIIVIIAGILVTVLITSAIVLRICLRKQKGDRSRSDSTIYVFDNAAA